MKKFVTMLLAFALIVSLGACAKSAEPATPDAAPKGLQVGYAKELIMPEEPVPLNGYGNNDQRMHDNVLDYIYVTCTAFKDGDETVLLIGQDLLNTEPATYDIFRLISEATGVPEDRIMVCSSHNHSGPDTDMPSHPAIRKYLQLYYSAAISAAQKALADLQPAELYGTSIKLEGMNFVRHYIMNDGTYSGPNFGSTASGYKGHATENDGEMLLVKIDRAGDNKDILMMNWGAHPTMTGGVTKYDLSADYVGVIRTQIEAEGMHFAFFQGAGGNQVTNSYIKSEKHGMNYLEYGQALAKAALEALPNVTKIEGQGIESIKVKIEAKVNHDDMEYLAEAQQVHELYMAGESRDVCNALAWKLGLTSQYHANAIVARQNRPETNLLRLDVVRIGGMAFIAAPYEMFSNQSIHIKENSPFEMTIISTCSNGDFVYIPSAEAYDYGCYESYVSYFAKGTGEQAADKFLEMLNELKN